MFLLSLVFLFILKLRFPQNKSIKNVIVDRYGQEGLITFRKFESLDLKYRKLLCDVEFLECCSTNNLMPKFLNFRLYSSSMESNSEYITFQKQLLHTEIENKRCSSRSLETEKLEAFNDLKQLLSYLDLNHIMQFIARCNDKKITKVKQNKNRKLFKLGLTHRYDSIDPNKVIFNFSDRILSSEEKEALSFGLKFCFNPSKLCYFCFFTPFEFRQVEFRQVV